MADIADVALTRMYAGHADAVREGRDAALGELKFLTTFGTSQDLAGVDISRARREIQLEEYNLVTT